MTSRCCVISLSALARAHATRSLSPSLSRHKKSTLGGRWCVLKYREAAQTGGVARCGTGILYEEPNPTGSRPRDLIGLCKPTETTDGAKRRRPKKPGRGRENQKDPNGSKSDQERVEEQQGPLRRGHWFREREGGFYWFMGYLRTLVWNGGVCGRKGGKLESCKQKIVLPFTSQDAARRRDRRRPGLQRLGALLVASSYCPHMYMPVGCWNRGFGALFCPRWRCHSRASLWRRSRAPRDSLPALFLSRHVHRGTCI